MVNQQGELLEEKVTRFVKCIQRRNKREILVAWVLIAIFALNIAYDIYRQNENTLLIIGGGVIILALLLNIAIIRWKLDIPRAELSAFPPTHFPGKWKHQLTHQARMLRLVWLWYLLPLFLGFSIYFLSFYDPPSGYIIIPLVIEIIAFAVIWRANLKAAEQIERDRDTWFGSASDRDQVSRI